MSNSKTTGIIWVRKRDGRAEPFQKSKVAACFRAAMITAGEGSAVTARELAEAVASFVHSSRQSQPFRTKQIGVLLVRVLEETGHPQAGSLMREHARQRDRRRRRVQVLAWKPSVGRIVPRRWNKSVLVHRLQKEYGLEPVVARIVAARVEEIVLTINLRLLTGTLVRELATCELMAWGLSEESLAVRPQRSSRSN